MKMEIRRVKKRDAGEILEIFNEVISAGDAFCSDESIPKEKVLQMWMSENTFVEIVDDEVAGAYTVFPLNWGRGSHIADAAYMVKSKFRRQGIGFKLAKHSLVKAKGSGYSAMQFNTVVSTNDASIHLWKKLGFRIIGKTPRGYNHKEHGFVDSLIMYKELT
jgi:L-amino acid N-acyltransferase YncA